MSTPGYENVDEEFVESSENHFNEMDKTIGDIVRRVDVQESHFDEVDTIISETGTKVDDLENSLGESSEPSQACEQVAKTLYEEYKD